jgi:glycosyltransferase involved in cell wall biosynthesis/2-polyprenyl-3-methyl-5-hydroxy-6-metoxy-1,4-benzoquinol methylase
MSRRRKFSNAFIPTLFTNVPGAVCNSGIPAKCRARWYSAIYGARNKRLLPLEPGHRFFLADQLAPRRGRILDVGCGTGNFLIAASLAGYAVSGIELDPNAATLASRFWPRARIFPVPLHSFHPRYPNELFDIVSFFEVLEHQADPAAFLSEVRPCLRPRGFIVLSVPNRNAGKPPRTRSTILPTTSSAGIPIRLVPPCARTFLRHFHAAGKTLRRLRGAAGQRQAALRPFAFLAPQLPGWFRDEIQQDRETKEPRNAVDPSFRTRAVQLLGRARYAACFPLAAAAIPYVRWRGHLARTCIAWRAGLTDPWAARIALRSEIFSIVFLSVLVDTYNHQGFIEKALGSVLDQDYPTDGFEIIVVDDGSTDNTPEIVRRFEPRVRLIRKKNGGQASAFNTGIPECRGDTIVFLDGDDWWAQGKLQRVAEMFSTDRELGMLGHAFIESFDDGAERVIMPGSPSNFRLDTASNADYFRLSRCYFGTSRLALRAELARQILPVPESLIFEADEYLFTMAPALAPALVLAEPLTHYRVHSGSLFLAAGKSTEGERRKANILANLATALRKDLPATSASPEAIALIVELVQAEADQLRLKLDGGWPWETFRTERTIFRIQHGDAHWKSSAFRTLSMIPALLLPAKWFYAGRAWLAAQSWYKRARAESLPVPGFTKLDAAGSTSPNRKAP